MSEEGKDSGVDWGDWGLSEDDSGSIEQALSDILESSDSNPSLDIQSAAQDFVDSIAAGLDRSTARREPMDSDVSVAPAPARTVDLMPLPEPSHEDDPGDLAGDSSPSIATPPERLALEDLDGISKVTVPRSVPPSMRPAPWWPGVPTWKIAAAAAGVLFVWVTAMFVGGWVMHRVDPAVEVAEASTTGDDIRPAGRAALPRTRHAVTPPLPLRAIITDSAHARVVAAVTTAQLEVVTAIAAKDDASSRQESLARVTVVTNPVKASVRLDGEKIGETPMVHQFEPGVYELNVRAPGFRTVTRKVSVLPGEHQMLDIDLEMSRRAREKRARERASRISRKRSGKAPDFGLPDITALTVPEK